MMRYEDLPAPDCPMGYTEEQVRAIMGEDIESFLRWMNGQTICKCEGWAYNHDTKQHEADACINDPHGWITYASDLRRFVRGGGERTPILD